MKNKKVGGAMKGKTNRFCMIVFALGWLVVFGTSFGCRVVSTGTETDYILSYDATAGMLNIRMNISDTVGVDVREDGGVPAVLSELEPNDAISYDVISYFAWLDYEYLPPGRFECSIFTSGGKKYLNCLVEIPADGDDHTVKFRAAARWWSGSDQTTAELIPDIQSPELHMTAAAAPSDVEDADPEAPPVDTDADGVVDDSDDCPDTPAGTVVDTEGCPPDPDTDGDGVNDLDESGAALDNCPGDRNQNQLDTDGDGIGNACDETLGLLRDRLRTDPSAGLPDPGLSANDSGGCSLAGTAVANPLAFILIGISLAPLAWRRRK